MQENRLPYLILAAVTSLGLALRLLGLDRKSVWFDEAVTAGFAVLSPRELLSAIAGDVNPPLYYLLLRAWWPYVRDDFWLRFPSALFSATTVAVTVLFGRRLLDWRAGLLAGTCTAISTFHIDLGQEARSYGLLSLLATLSLWLLLEAQRGGSWWTWLVFALTTTLVAYTHNYALFLLLAEAIFVAGGMAVRRSVDWRGIGAGTVIGVLFLPWAPALLGQVGFVHVDYWIDQPGSGVLWDTYYAFIAYSPPAHGWGMDFLSRTVRWGLLGVLSLTVIGSSRRPEIVLLVLALTVPVATAIAVSVWVQPIYIVRYVGFLVPAFWLAVMSGVDLLPAQWLRMLVAATVVSALLVNLPPLYGDAFYSRADLRSAAATVRASAAPGDLVVHTDLFTEYPFAYYDQQQLDETLLPEEDANALLAAASGRARFWYVRQFGLMDPTEEAAADRAARQYLHDWKILQQHDFLGVHLYLVSGSRSQCPRSCDTIGISAGDAGRTKSRLANSLAATGRWRRDTHPERRTARRRPARGGVR